MATVGNAVKVTTDNCPIEYRNGTTGKLRKGQVAGAFSDFVTPGPADFAQGVEIFTNHPQTGEPTTAVVPAEFVTAE